MRDKRWFAVLALGLLGFSGMASAAEWQVRADIPHCVYGHGGAVIGNRLYIIGGCEAADWTKTSTRLQIYDSAAGAYEGNIYIVHGARYEIGFHDMNDYGWADGVLKYQPASNTWTKIDAPRIQPRLFFLTQCTSRIANTMNSRMRSG